ncbi:MAG: dihydrolipoyl dehydrogenase [Candidatus Wallbacteria bacterium]|nr:dihydrolipoyl dehydrogenase [Candidatus Wallbacteria bacterium]
MPMIVVVGGGPGGYVAALCAARRGHAVTLVERESLGGTCLNRGCIPTKALIAGARLYNRMKNSSSFGVTADAVRFDAALMHQRKNRVVESLRSGIEKLLHSYKVDVLHGDATLLGNRAVRVQEGSGLIKELSPDYVILSPGSHSKDLPFLKADGVTVLDSTHALELEELPQDMLIIGGGVIGLEFAHMYSCLGVKITVIEALPQVLPGFDTQLTSRLAQALKKAGVLIKTGARISSVAVDSGATVRLESGEEFKSSKVLLSVGRKPDLSVLSDTCDVRTENGRISVNPHLGTGVPGVYAIGDAVSPLMLAHVASAQAEIAVENICGGTREFDFSVVPACVFSAMDYASVGVTEDDLKKNNTPFKSGLFHLAASSMALAMGCPEGLVKVLSSPDGRILGAHILGEGAPDMIHELALAMKCGIDAHQVSDVIHAHPTLSESVREACADVFSAAVHKYYR